MARITPSAAVEFSRIFSELGYEDAAIRLGIRPREPDSTEYYIDFIPDSRINAMNDLIQVSNGVMIVVRIEDEEMFDKVKIDYIDQPPGFVFGGGKR